MQGPDEVSPRRNRRSLRVLVPILVTVATVMTACSSGTPSASSTTSSKSSTSGTSSSSAANISATSFTRSFSSLAALRPLAAKGKGMVAAILPDTISSARYTEFDAPFLTKAFQAAGLTSSQYVVQNAQGSPSTELTLAQSDITKGATVLIMDPLNSGVGAQIESYAKAHGVAVIDYDRLTLGGSRSYYVSFNNVKVGQLIGQGFVSCVSAWHVAKPQVMVMHGSATDNNATLFAQGYMGVLKPYFSSGKYTDVVNTADTWNPPTALTEFQQAYTAHPNVNSAVIPNDETGAPILAYLKTLHIAPKTFPTTGQDATLVGLQNVLSGYQCGTVYKPIYLEAQAAAALAMYLRAGQKPPSALVNGSTTDTVSHVQVPSVLLKPEWVTPANMNSTVIADKFVPASQLCSGAYAGDCTAAGITP
ncbi:MAG: sugar ABC transporter substrate-binding protein [Acidimicrobiales bacterium]